MSRLLIYTAIVSYMLITMFAHAQTISPTPPPMPGKDFLTQAIIINLHEINVGELAQTRGSTPEVRNFGAMLVKDHTAKNIKAAKLARSLESPIPTAPSPDKMADYNQLSTLTGPAFDKVFLQKMVEGHTAALQLYTPYAQDGNRQIRKYVTEGIPGLQNHLKLAEQLLAKTSLNPLPNEASPTTPISATEMPNTHSSLNCSQSSEVCWYQAYNKSEAGNPLTR